MTRSTTAAALLLGLVTGALIACTERSEGHPPSRPSPSFSAQERSCPAVVGITETGNVQDPTLEEISGLAAGRRMRGILWVEEDSGNEAAVYALEPTGELVAAVTVDGATNQDWEDLAWADGHLWVGDIGDNARERSEIQVYTFAEPRDRRVTSVEATVIRLRYEDGPRDAEAMFVDARDETLYVIEKQLVTRQSTVYAIPLDDVRPGTVGVLRPAARVPMSMVTAADLGPAGIAVRNYVSTLVFSWSRDRSVASTLERKPCPVTLGPSEAIAQTVDGASLYSIPEGVRAPIGYADISTPTTR